MARIQSIIRRKIENETLWNLAVKDNESFVANGIVVHNCKSFIAPILVGQLGNREIQELKPSKAKLEDSIQFSETTIDSIVRGDRP